MTLHTHTPASEHLDSAPAARLRPPSWRDPRLILGLIIVLVSAAGVVALVASQDRTTPVYAADRTLSVGERLTEESLRTVDVQLGEGAEGYLVPGEALEEALMVSRVEEGELVPMRVLGEQDPRGRQPITVEIDHELSRAVVPGAAVDVWASAPAEYGADGDVSRLVPSAELADVRERESAFGTQAAVTVELLIGHDDVAGILRAVSEGRAISVLPAQPEPDEPREESAPEPPGEAGEEQPGAEDEQ
ncbi:hypothetical protein [Nesterenkonia populi]|uniref:hypothetical protein n=1 Tax=Nesterenkonia populi TaxID=1591087 RepID=UPI0011BE7AD0|nr:hypothetical protein [Nesterenkonia populi]